MVVSYSLTLPVMLHHSCLFACLTMNIVFVLSSTQSYTYVTLHQPISHHLLVPVDLLLLIFMRKLERDEVLDQLLEFSEYVH